MLKESSAETKGFYKKRKGFLFWGFFKSPKTSNPIREKNIHKNRHQIRFI